MCGKIKFHSKAPMLKYCQKSLNSCCASSLASVFSSIKQTKAANYILMHIEESLKIEVGNRIDFENAILKKLKFLKANKKCIIS